MKRVFDILCSLIGLLCLSPLMVPLLYLIWRQDRHSPFYCASRVGKDGVSFTLVKLRSMIVGADKCGVDSTAADDQRITAVGSFVRRYKLDEIPQLFNVLKGEMSLVGPRPNVERDVSLYTEVEHRLLSVRPGITDFSSIVFSDEGEILEGAEDPDLSYNQLIRPWKSRLGLFYIDHQSLLLDVMLIFTTVVAIVSRESALRIIVGLLRRNKASDDLIRIASRRYQLTPFPPPGATEVVKNREVSKQAQG